MSGYSNFPHYDQCPFPTNSYYIKDFPMDARVLRHFLPPGHYRLELSLVENDRELSKILFFGWIEDKVVNV